MPFNQDTTCLKHCLGTCSSKSKQHHNNLSHKYSLEQLIFGDTDERDYPLAIKIGKCLLKEDDFLNDPQLKCLIDQYYGMALFWTSKTKKAWEKCVNHLDSAITSHWIKPRSKLARIYNYCATVYDSELNDKNKAGKYYLEATLDPTPQMIQLFSLSCGDVNKICIRHLVIEPLEGSSCGKTNFVF